MKAWIEYDDDITSFIEIDVYDENGEMIESHGIPCRPLPWRMELDDIDILLESPSAGRKDDDR